MNDKLRALIKKIMLGATAALSTSTLSASSKQDGFKIPSQSTQTELAIPNLNKESKVPALVLQRPMTQTTESSLFHGSHASHYSGYSEPTYAPPPPLPKNEIKKPIEEKTTTESSSEIAFKLGSRILEKDMTGTDVAELQNLLIQKGYKIKITATFNKATEKAIMAYQKKEKIDITGKLDSLTLYYLTKK